MMQYPLDTVGCTQIVSDRPDEITASPALAPSGDDMLIAAFAETLKESRYREMAALGRPELARTRRRAEALDAWPPGQNETLSLPVSAGMEVDWLTGTAGQSGPAAKPGHML